MQGDLWLEVRACQDNAGPAARKIEQETVLRIPALSEALRVVEQANLDISMKAERQTEVGSALGGPKRVMWDYSLRLNPDKADDILTLFEDAKIHEDERSISRSADYSYCGRCYTLTLASLK